MSKKQTVARDPFYPDTLMYSFVYGPRCGAKTIFSGTLAECLTHLRDRSLEVKKLKYLVDEMSSFVGSSQAIIRHWLNGDHLPQDKRLICVQYYLSCLGYQLIELDGMPSLLSRLRESIAWGQISPQSMAKELGLTSSEVLKILTGPSWRRLDGKTRIVLKLCRISADLRQAEEDELFEALDQMPDLVDSDYCRRPIRRRRRS